MDGTTLCPHCNTRFRIDKAQMAAHHGQVRCGHCLQTFDAQSSFVPDLPDPQLKLPIAGDHTAPAEQPPGAASASPQPEQDSHKVSPDAVATTHKISHTMHVAADATRPAMVHPGNAPTAYTGPDSGNFAATRAPNRLWLWAIATLLALLILLGQAAYVFRTELAAHLPAVKPVLLSYCRLLKCSVPLPQDADLMSIESSNLEVEDLAHDNRIALNALLRNRASYAQAYPYLELTLNDSMDQPLARRIFHPADYLPKNASAQLGLLPNHELTLKLHLDTRDLEPVGYRLVLFYHNQ
jgi:predicted Zn finger-like uncharacterized protein